MKKQKKPYRYIVHIEDKEAFYDSARSDLFNTGNGPMSCLCRIELGFDAFLSQTLRFDKEEEINIGDRIAVSIERSPKNRGVWNATKVNDWDRKYQYSCLVEKIYDGDTVTKAVVDLGFGIKVVTKLRLYGIDTPELRGAEKIAGRISRDRLKELVLGKEVVIQTELDKRGKYGRHLATIYLGDVNINQLLVDEGLAKVNFY